MGKPLEQSADSMVLLRALQELERSTSECGSIRVSLAGNKLGSLLTPEGVTPLERLFRRFPTDGTLTATPERPFLFEIGSIIVPEQMAFALLDVRWAIYVPSGIAPGDTRELEDRRLSRQVSYDVTYTDSRKSNLLYELDPSFPTQENATYAPGSNAGIIPGNGISGVPQSVFDQLRAGLSGRNLPTGFSGQPQRHRRDAQLNMPFTELVNENKRVSFQVQVFRPIPIPVSFFEVTVSGFFIGQNAIRDFVKGVRNCKQ